MTYFALLWYFEHVFVTHSSSRSSSRSLTALTETLVHALLEYGKLAHSVSSKEAKLWVCDEFSGPAFKLLCESAVLNSLKSSQSSSSGATGAAMIVADDGSQRTRSRARTRGRRGRGDAATQTRVIKELI